MYENLGYFYVSFIQPLWSFSNEEEKKKTYQMKNVVWSCMLWASLFLFFFIFFVIFHKYFTFCKWDIITGRKSNIIIIKEFYLKSKL